jgi:glutamate 5-kinase
MVKADYLFLMTDVDCLYTANPRHDANAQPIEVVSDISTLAADVSTSGSSLGTGGMGTKIVAARLATSAGVTTVITKSSKPGNVHEIVRYLQESQYGLPAFPAHTIEKPEQTPLTTAPSSGPTIPPLHTRFLPSVTPIQSRSFWVLHGLTPHGNLYIDQGALSALQKKASLLPAGVLAVEGHFGQQEAVRLFVVEKRAETALNGDFVSHAQGPREIGRAIVNYGSLEIDRIKGIRSTHIHAVLGYADSEYVALRENISFFPKSEVPSRAETPALVDKI